MPEGRSEFSCGRRLSGTRQIQRMPWKFSGARKGHGVYPASHYAETQSHIRFAEKCLAALTPAWRDEQSRHGDFAAKSRRINKASISYFSSPSAFNASCTAGRAAIRFINALILG